ncbi:TRIC cation channel family protein [Streptomyces sp. NPDC048723]|uniref:TRIC cation channel family protein n=1 Tax=Streptomyces sp. NPDC048723 TaxID=3365589 RepID=UPI00371E6A51
MLHALYLLGTAAFAASGVLAAHRAAMDPFGGLVLAFAAAISGGTRATSSSTGTRSTGPTTRRCWSSSPPSRS